ncbi:hypothetical protein IFM89_036455 [Coptis chinensis]|uniref:Actin cross-linking n=1 Tax=Coptis chinensis TaxID=261450 RepID=A0A835HV33_9MAGN|nr:hypothetical protein IFM89_036455 [Coptis chinensis]
MQSPMEFFTKEKAIRLKSHLDKYLLAEDDQKSVRQSRQQSSKKVIWTVEIVGDGSNLIRLKSCHGQYLTASEDAFLLGMTGKKVIQTTLAKKADSTSMVLWEPIRDGFQVKLRTRTGSFLRANGATLPWRNSITHDTHHKSSTHDWVLWDVIMIDSSELFDQSYKEFESQLSSLSSSVSEDFADSPTSPWSSVSIKSPRSSTQLGMEFFSNAKAVRLKNHHGKYLVAEEDEESVTQERNGSSKAARWTVEFIHQPEGGSFIRLKSCYGKYLTASNSPFLLGMTGRKVTQTLPRRLDSSLEWEPIKDGFQVKLKTRYGNFLRANGGLPPWRNSVTHDIPQRTATQEWILWDIDVLEIQVHADSPKPKLQVEEEPSFSPQGSKLTKLESSGSFANSMQKAGDGRIIYYSIADDNGNVDDAIEEYWFTFKGNGVYELTHKLEEEIGIDDIIVCTRSPLNQKLYPLRLQLPPNNATMHVVVVPSSTKGEFLCIFMLFLVFIVCGFASLSKLSLKSLKQIEKQNTHNWLSLKCIMPIEKQFYIHGWRHKTLSYGFV